MSETELQSDFIAKEKERIAKIVEELLKVRDPEELKKHYDKLADEYDKDTKFNGYNGHGVTVNGFLELNLSKESRILDIAAGTGLVGSLLQKNGYTNIDALDANEKMLEQAKQKNCYKNLITSFVAKDVKLPIDDKTYDVVILCGCLCPGHIKWDSFPQVIRIVKQGGIVFWIVSNDKEYEKEPGFGDGKNVEFVNSLCQQNKWQYLPGFPKISEDYLAGNNSTLYAMKVL